MSTICDCEYFKHRARDGADASGEINLEGIRFLEEVRPSVLGQLAKRVGGLFVSFLRAVANSIRETPAEYNARVSRQYKDQPPVNGLR